MEYARIILAIVDEEPESPEEPVVAPAEVGRDDILMLLQSVPERIGDLIAGLDAGGLRYRHGPAFPTAGEVAAHTAQAGSELDHFVTAVALGTGAPPPLSTMLEAGTPATESIAGVLADWHRVRRRSIDLLRGLDGERWEAQLEDPQRGRLSFEEALRLVLRHELGHVAQLRNMTALVPEASPVVRRSNGTPRAVSPPDTTPEL